MSLLKNLLVLYLLFSHKLLTSTLEPHGCETTISSLIQPYGTTIQHVFLS